MKKHYLITGGAGFIGSNIAHELVKRGEFVRIIDNFSTGKRENLADILDKIDLIEGDIRYLNTVTQAMNGIDYVIHEAALPSVPRSIETPIESNDVNINGTLHILYAAKEAKVKRLVYAASSSAYGDTPTLPKIETMKPNPLSPYAVNKLTAEMYCSVFTRVYGLETVALRYFNIFGPRQDPNSYYSAVIPKFIKALLQNEPPIIFGDGEQSRDFTYIENVINANLLACKAPAEAAGNVVNVACGERITLNELAGELNKFLGKNIPPKHGNPRPGDIKHSLADVSLAEKLIGYTPTVKIPEGLKRTLDWFLKNKNALGL